MPPIGRCYCGQVTLESAAEPQVVTYCHCSDCKRWTGAPAPVFAAFETAALSLNGPVQEFSAPPGVTPPKVIRWTCTACGSPLAASFDYLPDQLYVPLGVLEEMDSLAPTMHCHAQARAGWLEQDGLPEAQGTGRDALQRQGSQS